MSACVTVCVCVCGFVYSGVFTVFQRHFLNASIFQVLLLLRLPLPFNCRVIFVVVCNVVSVPVAVAFVPAVAVVLAVVVAFAVVGGVQM